MSKFKSNELDHMPGQHRVRSVGSTVGTLFRVWLARFSEGIELRQLYPSFVPQKKSPILKKGDQF